MTVVVKVSIQPKYFSYLVQLCEMMIDDHHTLYFTEYYTLHLLEENCYQNRRNLRKCRENIDDRFVYTSSDNINVA